MKYLFPCAFWLLGWHHLWDGIVQEILYAIPWFPAWLAEVKVIIGFLRIDTQIKINVCSSSRRRL